MADDYASSTSTTGYIAVGGSATGEIETAGDKDWFAVELVAGRTYRFDLQGAPGGHGTLSDTFLRRILDAEGNKSIGDGQHRTYNDDFQGSHDSRVTFTATEAGTYYVEASGDRDDTGTYRLTVTDVSPPGTPAGPNADDTRTGATDLGDITALEGPRSPRNDLDGDGDRVDYYRFTLTEAKQVGLGLRQLDANADLFLEDAEGNVLFSSTEAGTANEAITETLLAGTYYARVEAQETGNNAYVFRYGVSEADPDALTALLRQTQSIEESPSFDQERYAYSLAENADGSTDRVALGTVSVTDPQVAAVTYSIEGGNEADLFEIDTSTGALSYKGSGENYESGATSFELTVRVSDGTNSSDATVTVNVADVQEVPFFGQQGYEFSLAENEDGSTDRVAVGAVSASDPEGAAVTYSIEGGNEADLFEIDASTGALSYKGSGEDYESGTTSFELTVRTSDGTNSSDATVTVNVADVQEVPFFGQQGYEFSLAENEDGSTDRVALGTVSATDPEGAAVTYSIEGGIEADLFEIDASTGALSYKGSGEDYESGATSFELTVRASDGNLHADTTVTINVTDVSEAITQSTSVQTPQSVSEPENADFSANTSTQGRIAVGGTTTGEIGNSGDHDWFAVELVAGRTYTIDLRGSPTGDGTLQDTYLRGIYDANGNRIDGTTNDDGGGGYNSRVTFAATESGTHYIAAGAYSSRQGTYELEVTDTSPPGTPAGPNADDTRTGATDLGDITALEGPRFPRNDLDGDGDRVDYYRFTLTEAKQVGLGLRQLDANADLFLEDAEGNVLFSSTEAGTANEAITETLLAGTYYARVEAQETGNNAYVFRYGVSEADPDALTALLRQTQSIEESPSFDQERYAYSLAENADGSTDRVALGTVSATDTQVAAVTYSIEGGNEADLFEIDTSTGALSYKGSGENYESGATSFELTVRVSDGTNSSDATVTVNVADVQEVPFFGQQGYEFSLAENEDGSTDRVAVGAVSASDPEGAAVTYSIEGGNEADLFEIDASTGALSYKGSGEDYESGTTSFELTVRTSDGNLHADTTVTINVTDVSEAITQSTRPLAIGTMAKGAVDHDGDHDWFAVTLEAGTRYMFFVGGEFFRDGEESHLWDAILHGIYDENGTLLPGTTNDDSVNLPGSGSHGFHISRSPFSHVYFTPEDSGTYYVAAGAHWPGQTYPGDSYRLFVIETADEYTADTETTGTVAVGDSVTGTLGHETDRDWIAVTLEAGKLYQIDLKGRGSGEGTLQDPNLRGIYDANGNLIAGTANDDYGYLVYFGLGGVGPFTHRATRDSRVNFAPDEDATYYVSVSSPEGNIPNVGTYKLSVVEIVDDYSADTGTTGTVEVDGSATGSIDPGDDVDWFRVSLEAGKHYRIEIKGADEEGGTLQEPQLVGVYDSEGNFLAKMVNFWLREDGTYFVAVSGTPRWNLAGGTYTVSVAEIVDDYSADTETTGAVAVGGSTSGYSGYRHDEDWFAVQFEEGKTYKMTVEGGSTGEGTYLIFMRDSEGSGRSNWIYDAAGGGLVAGQNFAYPPFYTATETGTHYIAVRLWEGDETYVLAVEEVTDDYSADTSTTGAVTVGGSTTGEMESGGDTDWFAVALLGGTTYQIDLEGKPTEKGTLEDPYIRGIYNHEGVLIESTTDDDSGAGENRGHNNSRVTFIPDADGTYYVAADANFPPYAGTGYSVYFGGYQSPQDTDLGTYELSVEVI